MSSKKKHGLGKGIGSLMNDYSFDTVFDAAITQEVPEKTVKKEPVTVAAVVQETIIGDPNKLVVEELPIDKVKANPKQPRKSFDEVALQELADSIKKQGVLQPILVEKVSANKYVIIAGERRYRAAKLAGLTTVAAIVRDFTDVERMEVSLVENIQRENLNPIEEAMAISYLLQEAGIKQEELAERIGKSRSAISNSIRLLNLPGKMQDALLRGMMTAGHARAILSVTNPAEQEILFKKIVKQSLSVRAAEQLANDYNHGKRAAKGPAIKENGGPVPMKSADMLALEEKFREACGSRVELKGSLDGGKLEISYHSQDDLERLYQMLAPGADLFEI